LLEAIDRPRFDFLMKAHIGGVGQPLPVTSFQCSREVNVRPLAATCLYDNMKVVVTGYDGDQPVYNTRFLAFATHYGFQPWACRRRRPQTKGKIERPFAYIENNLLNSSSMS
jgi:hypothetical protein